MLVLRLAILLSSFERLKILVDGKVLDRKTIQIAKGSSFELKCQNKTDGDFAVLLWRSNRINTVYSIDAYGLEKIDQNFINRIKRFDDTSIRIEDSKMEDQDRYECNIVYNKRQSSSSKLVVDVLAVYDLVVISPPFAIFAENQLVSTIKGSNIKVYCEVQALSNFNITWLKTIGEMGNNTIFQEESEEVDDQTLRITYIKRSYMIIKGLTQLNTGRYRCVAHNIGGQMFKDVHVRMQSKPRIISNDSFHIDVNENGYLICKARGYPIIRFQWRFTKDNEKVTLNPLETYGVRYEVSYSEYDSQREIGSSRFQIRNTRKRDYRLFTCIAENDVGIQMKTIKLDGFAFPDPPTIIKSEIKVFVNSILLCWRYGEDGNQPVNSVTIQYRNRTSLSWSTIQIHQYINEYMVTQLREDTFYEFKILATNVIGDSRYSKTVEVFTTSSLQVQRPGDDNEPRILGDLNTTSLISILGGTFIALLIAFICICLFMRRVYKTDQNEQSNHNSTSFIGATPMQTQYSLDGGNIIEMEPLMSPADEWEFPRERLQITTVLGSGAFGIVMRGLAQGIKGSIGQVNVAVKMVRDNSNEMATKDLTSELSLLKLIPEHPNVVGLLGCCTRAEPKYVIVEYCSNGDLQGFLRSSRGIYERYYRTSYGGAIPNLTAKMLLTFAWQITKGMAHLAGMKVIHRDLAARNILVNDQLICKISDFGFARDTYLEDHYLKRSTGGRFPIKWMAIESLLDSISTTKSDVWSFGVVLWELVTLGASPYPGMNSYEVVSFLQDGYRMDKPKHCSDEIYALMMECWNISPGRRPTFNDLAEKFKQLVESSSTTEYISMNYYQEHLYINFDVNSSMHSVATISESTTPHSTLSRRREISPNTVKVKDFLNHNDRGRPPPPLRSISTPSNGRFTSNSAPRTLRANINTPNKVRTNSVTELSDRSATGTSTMSAVTETSTLLSEPA